VLPLPREVRRWPQVQVQGRVPAQVGRWRKSWGSSRKLGYQRPVVELADRLFVGEGGNVVDHVVVHQDTPGDRESNQFRIRVGLDYIKQESRNQLEVELEFK
jgi:hypothetical protein